MKSKETRAVVWRHACHYNAILNALSESIRRFVVAVVVVVRLVP
jgi:hypothetical protein